MSTITFRTEVQACLFEREVCGQISDGHWENFDPSGADESDYDEDDDAAWDSPYKLGHWKPWCTAAVTSSQLTMREPGRDFDAYDGYDLRDGDLLEIVGERMVAYARLCKAFGRGEVARLDNEYLDLGGAMRKDVALASDFDGWARGEPGRVYEALHDQGLYGWPDLIRDLGEMMRAMRTSPGGKPLPRPACGTCGRVLSDQDVLRFRRECNGRPDMPGCDWDSLFPEACEDCADWCASHMDQPPPWAAAPDAGGGQ
jgi:hypothetical protein